VDRCASDFVKSCRCSCNGLALIIRKAGWQSKFEFRRYSAGFERGDKSFNAFEQFSGGRFGEGYSGDVARPNAMRQHQGYAAGHQGGFAAAGACLDEERRIVIQQRAPARVSIRKGRE
jgi:hypothetical protein